MKIIELLPLEKDLKSFLMTAIAKRRSKRRFSQEKLSMRHLSNILWVYCGETRPSTERQKSRRTVPSALNGQAISVYVALNDGLYLYDERAHVLQQQTSSDLRSFIGTQKMMQGAPVGLIYVTDATKRKAYLSKDLAKQWFVAGTEVGFMSQNVYLYCSATHLNTVVLGLVNREQLEKLMELPKYKRVVYTQVIGYPLK